jgi:hypothetical protein
MQSRIGAQTWSLLGLPVRMHEEEFEVTALETTSSDRIEISADEVKLVCSRFSGLRVTNWTPNPSVEKKNH